MNTASFKTFIGQMTIYDLLGSLGVVFIIITYLLLQMGKLSSRHRAYSLWNAVGSVLIMVSLIHQFNFSAFLIELFWLFISVYGLFKALRSNKEP